MGKFRKIMMHDTHCHLDLYPDPYQVAVAAEEARVTTVAVTNLPSAYYAAKPHMGRFRSLKLALGLHPLLANDHSSREKQLFQNALQETQYIGEIGLDFSKYGIGTKEKQLESFQFVLTLLQNKKRFITLHSRRAESTVLELLTEYQIGPVVFHWYSGSIKIIVKAITAGHYFSVNPSMIRTKSGQTIIQCIPRERILTETDGPFVKIKKLPAVPTDVKHVHRYLSKSWNCELIQVQRQLDQNLIKILK